MAKIQIDLELGETVEQVEGDLLKALLSKRKDDDRSRESYDDPLLNELHDELVKEHELILEKLKLQVQQEIRHSIQKKF